MCSTIGRQLSALVCRKTYNSEGGGSSVLGSVDFLSSSVSVPYLLQGRTFFRLLAMCCLLGCVKPKEMMILSLHDRWLRSLVSVDMLFSAVLKRCIVLAGK